MMIAGYDLDYKKLPNQFIIKATHASSYNLIVRDKEKLNKTKTAKLFKKWLGKNQYYRTGQEWAYKDVQPRLIAEKLLKDEGFYDIQLKKDFRLKNRMIKAIKK